MTIADPNAGQTETVKVTLSLPGNGTLSSPTGTGGYNATTGVYTVSGSPAAVTAALNALLFTPTPRQVPAGRFPRPVYRP